MFCKLKCAKCFERRLFMMLGVDKQVIQDSFPLRLCLHVACACPFALTSTSTLALSQWLTQGMGFRPILCMCICVTINTMLNLTLTLMQTGTCTLLVNKPLTLRGNTNHARTSFKHLNRQGKQFLNQSETQTYAPLKQITFL